MVSGSCGHKFTFVLVRAAMVLPLDLGQSQVDLMEGGNHAFGQEGSGEWGVTTLP